MNLSEQATQGASLGKSMALGGGGGAVIFGYNAQVVGVVAGIVIGIVGLCIQWYFSRRQLAILKDKVLER